MQEPGSLYRQLRKERHLTLQQVADSENSVSFISKFEKGSSQISFNRMMHLLGKINFSVEEFLYLQGRDTIQPIKSTFMSHHPIYLTAPFMTPMVTLLNSLTGDSATSATLPRSIEQYDAKIHQLEDAGNLNWQHYLAILYQIQKVLIQNDASPAGDPKTAFTKLRQLSRPIVTYLYNIDNWSTFEILLFSISHFAMPLQTVHRLSKIAIKRTTSTETFPMMPQMRFELLFGLFSTYINFREMTWAKETLDSIVKLLEEDADSNFAIMLRFYRGWYDYIDSNGSVGEEMMTDVAAMFKLLNLRQPADLISKIIPQIKRNQRDPEKSMIFLF